MSINVHVTGNPISIKRGKMVTADLDVCKKEFDKRRLMRLEQVRQQSKNIAEGLRNKVKKEKKVQMKEIEEDGKQKLKNWQNRKLLELQTQYQGALKEIGVAHKAAQTLGDENELLAEQDRLNREKADKRGKTAESRLYSDKLKEEVEKARLDERRKLIREIENTRAQFVKSAPRSKRPKVRKKKILTDDQITTSVSYSDDDDYDDDYDDENEESEAEMNHIDLSDVEEIEEIEESSSCSCAAEISETTLPHDTTKKKCTAGPCLEERPPAIVPPLHLAFDEPVTTIPPNNSPRLLTSKNHNLLQKKSRPIQDTRISDRIKIQDTRISDRIKHRAFLCDEPREVKSPEPTQIPIVESRTDVRDFIRSRRCHTDCICCCKRRSYYQNDEEMVKKKDKIEMKDKDVQVESKDHQGTQTSYNQLDQVAQNTDIPSQPSVKLKSLEVENRLKSLPKQTKKLSPVKIGKKTVSPNKTTKKMPKSTGSKIQVYDHSNRFSSEQSMPSGSFVEKIPIESLEYITDPASEEERLEAIRRRERDAQSRGKRALEKEKLQREYEEMLKKLPLLQKKERICEIYNDKLEFHMSEERLKEKELTRQNNLDNVYSRLYPNLKPAHVALPKTNQTKEESSMEAGSNQSLNVAEWDVDHRAPYRFSSQEVQDIIKEFIKQNPRDRRAKLKELLKKLKIQKQELLNAMNALPKNDSLDELINDLKSFRDTDVRSKSKSSKSDRKRSRKDNEADTSIDSSHESSSKDIEEPQKEIPCRTSGRSPRKKAKTRSKPNVIILQNTSTQTTPKTEKQVEKKEAKLVDQSKRKCNKLHVPCDCNKENEDVTDDLCHIYIKLNEDEIPEVLVKSKDKENVSKAVLSKHTTVGTQISPELGKKARSTIGTQISPELGNKDRSRPKSKPTELKPQADISVEKSRTWKEQFSKNSISTTSTSYLSPPDFQTSKPYDKSSLYNLRTKPQQEELSSVFSSTKYNLRDPLPDALKPFVKRLLSMSKTTVDNLSVSTSNVETPSQSVIEMETNVPSQDLKEMVEKFKDKIEHIADHLSYSPDFSPVPFNTSASTSLKSQKETISKTNISEKPSSSSLESGENLVAQYAKISNSVTNRIKTLAAMIENLREEKIKMLQVSKSKSFQDKDLSTTYMDLPDLKSASTSSSASMEEDEILRKLMEIDQSVLDKMGKRQQHGSKDIPDNRESDLKSPNSTNQEIIERLQRLKDQDVPSTSQEPVYFLPFLSDIPKLPKFEPQTDTGQLHKRPPPSKGLTAAKKFNGNISLVPHELSTIVEADSQISAKPHSPETSGMNLNKPLLTIPEIELRSGSGQSKKSPKESSKSSSGSSNPNTSNKDESKSSGEVHFSLLSSSASGSSKKKCNDSTSSSLSLKQFSSSSSDDIETIESMLRSIGMDWAIPTLHKTQEALALGSSSSSLDLSKKLNQTEECSGNEVSLRGYLRKKFLNKVSSSTMLSDRTPASFIGEHSDVSGIQSSEKSKQRTSTPINLSKSTTSKSKAVFTDSDLSSIKHDSTESKRKR